MAGMGGSSSGQMSPDTARRLAALIATDAQQLAEKAQEQGVTAFLGRAVKRERPNERFLHNTLRNLASANKRQEERAMWAAREAEQGQQQQQQQPVSNKHSRWSTNKAGQAGAVAGSSRHSSKRVRHHSPSPSRSRSRSKGRARSKSRSPSNAHRSRSRGRMRSPRGRSSRDRSPSNSVDRGRDGNRRRSAITTPDHSSIAAAAAGAGRVLHAQPAAAHNSRDWAEEETGADQQLLQWLAGSKAVKGRGSIGPHADVTGPYLPPPQNPEALQEAPAKGPAKPPWLQGAADGGVRLRPSAAFLRGVLTSQGLAGGVESAKPAKGAGDAAVDGGVSRSSSSGSGSGSGSRSEDSSRSKRESRRKGKHKRGAGSKKKHKKHEKHKSRHKAKSTNTVDEGASVSSWCMLPSAECCHRCDNTVFVREVLDKCCPGCAQ